MRFIAYRFKTLNSEKKSILHLILALVVKRCINI